MVSMDTEGMDLALKFENPIYVSYYELVIFTINRYSRQNKLK